MPAIRTIQTNVTVETGDYHTREAMFSHLGRLLDDLDRVYGGVISNIETHSRMYDAMDGLKREMVTRIIVEHTASGVNHDTTTS